MSPLALVGILVIASSAIADVKHVLEGSAHPPYNNGGSKIDVSKNPFLSGAVVSTGDGAPVVKGQDGFLGVQPAQPFAKKPGFATTHPLDQKKKPFATKHPLDNSTECKGVGFACVERSTCVNGVVNKNGEGLLQVRSDVSNVNNL
jgi:hypothetical protein